MIFAYLFFLLCTSLHGMYEADSLVQVQGIELSIVSINSKEIKITTQPSDSEEKLSFEIPREYLPYIHGQLTCFGKGGYYSKVQSEMVEDTCTLYLLSEDYSKKHLARIFKTGHRKKEIGQWSDNEIVQLLTDYNALGMQQLQPFITVCFKKGIVQKRFQEFADLKRKYEQEPWFKRYTIEQTAKNHFVAHVISQKKVISINNLISKLESEEESIDQLSHKVDFFKRHAFLEIVESQGKIDESLIEEIGKNSDNYIVKESKSTSAYILKLNSIGLQTLQGIEKIMPHLGMTNDQVIEIQLSHNNLTYVDWENLYKIFPFCVNFDLSYNQLTEISTSFLKAHFNRNTRSAYHIITLSNNKIKKLPLTQEDCALWVGLSPVYNIKLDSNLITKEDREFLIKELHTNVVLYAYFVKKYWSEIFLLSLLLTSLLIPQRFERGFISKLGGQYALSYLLSVCFGYGWGTGFRYFMVASTPNIMMIPILFFTKMIGYQLPGALYNGLRVISILWYSNTIPIVWSFYTGLRNNLSTLLPKLVFESEVKNEQ